jgi:hypothetical protein
MTNTEACIKVAYIKDMPIFSDIDDTRDGYYSHNTNNFLHKGFSVI